MRAATWAEIEPLFDEHLKRFAKLYDQLAEPLAMGGASLIIKSHTDDWYSSSAGSCGGGHTWTWSGDLPDWPYDGMPCDCGETRYDKCDTINQQIKSLEQEWWRVHAERLAVHDCDEGNP